MKWYGYFLIAALLLLALSFVRAPIDVVEQEEVQQPVAFVPVTDEQPAQNIAVYRQYDLYVIGNEFIPVTYESEAGDTVELTLVTDIDETIDLYIPELGVVEELDAGESVAFETPNAGNFDFFCITCGPQLQGNILVHE